MIAGLKAVQIAEQQHLRDLIASGLITDYSLALDGGAHLGGWTVIMAEHFSRVVAIEPSEAIDQLRANCADLPNVMVVHAALMAKPGRAVCVSKLNRALTSRRFVPGASGQVDAITIDSLELDQCGLLKLDIEGGELAALHGARQTIARFWPFILCEMAGFPHDAEAKALLLRLGYRQVFERGVDKGFAK